MLTATHGIKGILKHIYYKGISGGDQANNFNPNDPTTRAHLAAFLSRTMKPSMRLDPDQHPTENVVAEGEVTADVLNVRSKPRSGAPEIGELKLGDKVDIYNHNGWWLKIKYNGQYAYVHKNWVKEKSVNGSPVNNRIIVIDAGHGGGDNGASGNGYLEKNVNLAVTKHLKDYLSNAGAKFVMTRNRDVFIGLDERVNIAKGNYADIFVSIHSNSFSAPSANGSETYYDDLYNGSPRESRKLAASIQDSVTENMHTSDRGVKSNWYVVIRENDFPSALVELGFISNPQDAAKLGSAKSQKRYAKSIFEGIVNYYRN